MAVALRNGQSIIRGTRVNTTLTAPTGIQNGDVLLIWFLVAAAAPATPTPPAGFTILPGSWPISVTLAGFTGNAFAWQKIASAESGNYTVTHASTGTEGWIAAYSGADGTTPINPNPTLNSGTGTTSTGLGLTTATAGSMVVFAAFDWGDTANVLTAPTGTTPTFTKEWQGTNQFVADGALAAAGATGNKTMTNNSTGADPWAAALIAIAAPGAVGGGPTPRFDPIPLMAPQGGL